MGSDVAWLVSCLYNWGDLVLWLCIDIVVLYYRVMKQKLHLVVHSKGRAAALQNEPTSEVTDAKEDKRLALTTSDQKYIKNVPSEWI